jgi:hypothetical protein
MTRNLRLPLVMLPLAMLALLQGAGGAAAQSAGLDEATGPSGAPTQTVALSPVQRTAIYNAVTRQRVRSSGTEIAAMIGAAVPPSAALHDLPDQAPLGDEDSGFLKYAMVQDQVVIVDPISMRVVDVIRPGARP